MIKDIKSWSYPEEQTELKQTFMQVLDTYVEANYPHNDTGNSLMCSIHDSFKVGHNCVGCNLQEQTNLLIRFLANYNTFEDIHLTATQFHLLLYLKASRINTYIDYIELQQSHRYRHFGAFQQAVRWANFLKHPKSFMLVHHASYLIDGLNASAAYYNDIIETAKQKKLLIDDDFVKEFYSGTDQNQKLHIRLSNKEGVVVLFPNPIELMKRFVGAQAKFVELIRDNALIREILDDKASIKAHFINED